MQEEKAERQRENLFAGMMQGIADAARMQTVVDLAQAAQESSDFEEFKKNLFALTVSYLKKMEGDGRLKKGFVDELLHKGKAGE